MKKEFDEALTDLQQYKEVSGYLVFFYTVGGGVSAQAQHIRECVKELLSDHHFTRLSTRPSVHAKPIFDTCMVNVVKNAFKRIPLEVDTSMAFQYLSVEEVVRLKDDFELHSFIKRELQQRRRGA